MSWQQHIIKRQLLEFRIPQSADSFALQQEMARIYREDIVPMLDDYLNRYSLPDEVDRIDRLELDLGKLDSTNLRASFIEQARIQLEEQLPPALGQVPGNDSRSFTLPDPTENIAEDAVRKTAFTAGNKLAAKLYEHAADKSVQPEEERRIASASDEEQKASKTAEDEPASEPLTVKRREAAEKLVAYYLHTGLFPWWAKEKSLVLLEKSFHGLLLQETKTTTTSHALPALSDLLANETALERLIYTFPDETLFGFMRTALPDKKALLKALQQYWQTFGASRIARLSFWTILLPVISGSTRKTEKLPQALIAVIEKELQTIAVKKTAPAAELKTALQSTVLLKSIALITERPELASLAEKTEKALRTQQESRSAADAKDQKEVQQTPGKKKGAAKNKEDRRRVSSAQFARLLGQFHVQSSAAARQHRPKPVVLPVIDAFSDSEKIFVENAGLVLLWPFLRHFFSLLGLIGENGEWTGEKAAGKASLMLGIVVSEETGNQFEALLPLNKILCGIDPGDPVDTQQLITEDELALAENLLEVVASRLEVLGELGPESLREAWIRREGLLSARDGNFLLQVERRSYDVLLGRIPWGFRIIRLPWMKEMLVVEW